MSNHGPENRGVNLADLFRGSVIVGNGKNKETITISFKTDPKRKTIQYGVHLVGEQEGQKPWHSGAWGTSPEVAIGSLEPRPRELAKKILSESGVIFPNGSSPK